MSLYLENPFARASKTSFAFVILEISAFRYIDTSFSSLAPGDAISSIIFYYIEFGKFSLIGSQASSISNINFHHFISYYFDLDQGLWIGAPWVVLFILLVKKKNNSKLFNDLIFSLILIIQMS